jgi:hypothetical protein
MRSRAAPELFVGGFTQVWLEVPVLSLASLDDETRARRAVVFFLAACLARSAAIARIEIASPARARDLIAATEASFAGALRTVDGENVGLMGYFDVYLSRPEDVPEDVGRRLAGALADAIQI